MTPGHDLDGARSVVALDVAPVRNPRLLERYVPAEAVAVDDCVLQNDGVEEKGRQVALVQQRPRARSAAPIRRCGNAAQQTGSLAVRAPRTGKPVGQSVCNRHRHPGTVPEKRAAPWEMSTFSLPAAKLPEESFRTPASGTVTWRR